MTATPPPEEPSDPLLQSLVGDAAGLPARAALAARRRQSQRRQTRRRITAGVIVLLAGAGAWSLLPKREAAPPAIAGAPTPAPAPTPIPTPPPAPAPRVLLQVQTEEEARLHPLPMPDGLDKEQQALVAAAPGLPLLLVRDGAGKVTRIHVIERP